MDMIKKHSTIACWGLFAICLLARIIEYFFIRTDETILAENFLHKIFGIVLLFVILKITDIKWKEIGFAGTDMLEYLVKGFLLGAVCFVVAYEVEYWILFAANKEVHMALYVSGFSLDGEMEQHTGLIFILMCLVFNIINVWMEEGIFRGLFSKFTEDSSYKKSIALSAFLFGIWHLVMPLRDYMEGTSSLINLMVMGIGYIILAGIMSVKWSFLYTMTGSLWAGIGDHLFNNVIVTNIIHVISNNESDSLQIVRIVVGQLISFILVYAEYRYYRQRTTAKQYESQKVRVQKS